MKILENKTNAQNAQIVEKRVSREQKQERNQMSKISNVAFRKSLEASGLETSDIDKLVNNAVLAGTVSASSRVGKLLYAPKPVLDAWDFLNEVVEEHKQEWQDALPSGQEINKISLNCSK